MLSTTTTKTKTTTTTTAAQGNRQCGIAQDNDEEQC
jgi:hypothetical protein